MIRLQKSTFYEEEQTKLNLSAFIAKAKILSMSEECRKFEQAFAKKQHREFAVFVSSGSMANFVLIQALLNLQKLQKGDQVGVSALTWATNIMPLLQLGLRPVAIDCDLQTLNVSSSTLATGSYSDIRLLFLTNVLGFCADLQDIRTWCQQKNILLCEDNCESLGSRAYGKLLGNFGLASTFSFFVGHHLSTIEGGMICTDDEELCDMLLLVRAHGWDRNLSPEKQQSLRKHYQVDDFIARYTFYDLACNARPTEISGFLGNEQLPYWDEIVRRRQENFLRFHAAITANPDFLPLKIDHMDTVSNFAMPIVCRSTRQLAKYKQRFQEKEVEIRPIIAGDMTRQPFYRKHVPQISSCPHAALIHEQGLYFPNNPELDDSEIDTLIGILQ